MAESRVAGRYAKSLIDLAVEKGVLKEIKDDMDLFTQVAEENSQFMRLLQNPIINHAKKLAILKGIFQGKVNNMTFSFFEILTRKNRESVLYDTAKQFIAKYNAMEGIEMAVVTTAIPIDDNLRAQLRNMVLEKTGNRVEFKEKVNPDIIGGYILQIGDRMIDDSVRSRLNSLRVKFSDNPYIVKY
jgi:F-type H+-transporting ATPase subunit delta